MTNHADSHELMNQAVPTVFTYYMQIKEKLNKMYGEGYAEKNPNLVASLVDSATKDMVGNAIAIALEKMTEAVGRIAESSEYFKEIEEDLSSIADLCEVIENKDREKGPNTKPKKKVSGAKAHDGIDHLF